MWDFNAKIDEQTPFSGVIFKCTKKTPFQYLTFKKNDNCVIYEKMVSQYVKYG